MINVKCDMCKCNIDYNLNGINLDFNHFGDVKMLGGEEREYQLCNVCASKVHEFIERGVENDRSAETSSRTEKGYRSGMHPAQS